MATPRDDNGYPVLFGLSCTDGVTPVQIKFNASNGGIEVDATTVISITPAPASYVNTKGTPIATGVSSTDDTVILPWYVNPATGAVLIST